MVFVLERLPTFCDGQAMPKRTNPAKDANQTAAALVRAATGTGRVNAESLFGDPAMAARFKATKQKAKFEEIASRPGAWVMDLRTFNPRGCLVRTL